MEFRSHPDPSSGTTTSTSSRTSWPKKERRRYWIIPSICFNCESACGILAYVDKETLDVRKIEGNPLHPGSRGRTCAKGVVTPNQLEDPDRILYPAARATASAAAGKWQQVSVGRGARRHRRRASARRSSKDAGNELMYHVGRPGEDGYANRVLQAWGLDGHNSHTNVCSSSARLGHFLWMRRRSAVARLRERADDPAAVVAPRDRATTSIRTRSASSKARPTARR